MTSFALASAFSIRETSPDDLEEILRHRRLMFYDMGYHDEDVLDRLVQSSRAPMRRFLADGSYRGWFAIAAGGRVVAGVGLLITELVSGPLIPDQICRPRRETLPGHCCFCPCDPCHPYNPSGVLVLRWLCR